MNFYEILGVSRNATLEEISKAFKIKARILHPDINQAPEATVEFKKVLEAHETLSDMQKRSIYNAKFPEAKKPKPVKPKKPVSWENRPPDPNLGPNTIRDVTPDTDLFRESQRQQKEYFKDSAIYHSDYAPEIRR